MPVCSAEFCLSPCSLLFGAQYPNEPRHFSRNRRLQFALDSRRGRNEHKAVTQMTDPEYTVEFDGKETYVMRNGVKLAMRRDDRWVSIEPGIAVRDIVEEGRHGIEVRMTVH